MKRLASLSLFAALAWVPACGDDTGGGTPDAPVGFPDAMVTPDSSVPTPDASPDADVPTPDAREPDAMVPLVGIADARGVADGATSVSIEDVLVTYKKVAIGNDVAGFFIQSVQTGPALFIAVDPTGLTPEPQVGDNVTFTITEMGTSGMLRQATMITNLTVNSSGNDVTGLVQDVTAAGDLVSAIGDYESELITGTFTVVDAFGSAGSEHVAATIENTTITGDTNLKLRLPVALQDVYGFENTCSVTVSNVPMWRFVATAQVSAWDASELTATCPAPTVVSATATSATTVDVVFSRGINAATIVTPATQFTITGGTIGLVVSMASVNGRTVTLTTTPQSPGESYTVTVDTSVMDVLGVGIGTPDNTTFNGFGTPESVCNDGLDDDSDGFVDCQDANCAADAACAWGNQLYLWEVDADQSGTDALEFVEIWNNTGGSVDLAAGNYYLLYVNGSNIRTYNALALTGTIGAGDVFVIGPSTAPILADQVVSGTEQIQNGADGFLLVQCATCTDAATDFPTTFVVPSGALGTTFTTAGGATATKIDGVAYDTSDADIPGLMDAVGVTVQYNENSGTNGLTDSLHRTSLTGWTALPSDPQNTGLQP